MCVCVCVCVCVCEGRGSHQFGISAFSGPLNIVPTLVACSLEE